MSWCIRRKCIELCTLQGLRPRMPVPEVPPWLSSWHLTDMGVDVSPGGLGQGSGQQGLIDGLNAAELQVPAVHGLLGQLRMFTSVTVGGQGGGLSGGLVPVSWVSSRNPFLEGSVRFKSQKKKKKKKGHRRKASREDTMRLQMLRRERKMRKLSMSPEELLKYRMQKARKKIERHEQAIKKYALPETPSKPDDPEVLTPEQLHALKKIGYKNRNYVPVGRRGVYGGTIQNMHMHWKKHETVRIDCQNQQAGEVKAIARELEKLSGGKVIDIHQGTTIIMYRGRNYKQPKKLIPDNMLDKRKALLKSQHAQSLQALREYVGKLEIELKKVQIQMALEAASAPPQEVAGDVPSVDMQDPAMSSQALLQAKLADFSDESDLSGFSDSDSGSDLDSDWGSSTDTEADSDSESESDASQYREHEPETVTQDRL